jgi:hypothetical protein
MNDWIGVTLFVVLLVALWIGLDWAIALQGG